MIKTIFKYIVLLISVLLFSCEDKIDLNLKDDTGKYVIVADLHNAQEGQTISIQKTVPFNQNSTDNPVLGASVIVKNVTTNRNYVFTDAGNGNYNIARMSLREGDTYALSIKALDGDTFESTVKMPKYVVVDSLGLIRKTRFNDEYLYVNLNFADPKAESNYYKYKLNVNNAGWVFSDIFDDKFNNGLIVDHELSNEDDDLKIGDRVQILRQCVTKDVYTYWSNIKSLNPGSAAPANPTSNISNGALGYFSVSSAHYYDMEIKEN